MYKKYIYIRWKRRKWEKCFRLNHRKICNEGSTNSRKRFMKAIDTGNQQHVALTKGACKLKVKGSRPTQTQRHYNTFTKVIYDSLQSLFTLSEHKTEKYHSPVIYGTRMYHSSLTTHIFLNKLKSLQEIYTTVIGYLDKYTSWQIEIWNV